MNPTDIETQTLALLTVTAMDSMPFTSVAYTNALPTAYACLQATKAFLKNKEEQAEAKEDAFWNSPEGQKRRAEAVARFEEFKKRNNP